MTTLVYRDGILAADSRGTVNGYITPALDQKVFKLGDGRLLGFTGEANSFCPFKQWVEDGEMAPAPEMIESRAVVIAKTGPRRIFEGKGWYEERGPFSAWGSGMAAALAALYMGATAVEAVRIAIKVDSNSGGRVRWFSVRD